MKLLVILLTVLHLVTSQQNLDELKIDYYVKAIKEALSEAKVYKSRKNNSDLLGNRKHTVPLDYGEFDFIVVGSGSSGSAVAASLSEIEEFKILLLDAGEFDDDLTSVPYLATLFQISDRNWGYFSSPQHNACLGWKYQSCSFPRGKILGGIGTFDSLSYNRGNRGDYDKWASLGNPGWSFAEVLPYFKKLENFNSDKIDLNYRGFGGPVNVAYVIPKPNFTVTGNAYEEVGVEYVEDYNAEKQIGVSRPQLLTKFGKRVSGSTAFVRPTFTRHNYNVTLSAFVTKLLINVATKTVYGVQFVRKGKTYQATVRKEVLIAAGIINNPQLLMLSGIGPADELSKHKIPVIANLPVGRGFKGNVVFDVFFTVNRTIPTQALDDALRDFFKGKGVLTSFQNGLSVSFHNTRDKCSRVPNLQIDYYTQSPLEEQIPALVNFIPKVEEFAKKRNRRKELSFQASLLHPKSTGNITLKSNNPADFPNLNLGIFDNVDDMEVLYEGIQLIKAIEKTKATKFLNSTLVKYDFCDEYEYDSKEYWFCALRKVAHPGTQWASSTKMGPKGDPDAVVDNMLRVHGIKKLRVVDRGTVPVSISGSYNSLAFMMGEKAAAMIKEDYGVSKKCIIIDQWIRH